MAATDRTASPGLSWHHVADTGDLPEGRVTTVTAGRHSLALTHVDGEWAALSNRCPHQGGPLGEGSIERGMLRCPWHGYDYCPLSGDSPFGDAVATFPLEIRDDGGVYVGLEPDAPHERTVSDLMAETMVAWGVRHVFGMVGHSNLGLADAIRRQEEAGNLEFVGIRHEGAAAFAASAYGKLTGTPAACLTIAGPGATNLLTGLWDAKVDRSPVLALTGQVDAQVLGPGAFQEVDLAGAFGTVAAWSQTVLHTSAHAELMSLAVKHARLTPGVAHLIFPDEVQTLPAPDGTEPGAPAGRTGDPEIAPPEAALEEALARLRAARRPVIVAGQGARVHRAAVLALAEQLGAPVITTFKAKGLVPDAHPLAAGVLGRSGTPVASWLMNECDLMLVLGASFSNHTGIYARKPIVQVDLDPMQLGRVHPVTVPVWGEIGVVVGRLRAELPERPPAANDDQRAVVAERRAIWQAEKASRAEDDRGRGVNSAIVFAALSEQVPGDAVLTVDVGNHAYSFGRYFECGTEQDVLMSGYLGSIGFGYPAAIGAAVAAPGRKIVAVTGDGGYAQYMAELTTAVKHDLDITHVLLNNGQLGKISKEQRAGDWDVWQTSLHNPEFAGWAKLCGAHGERVTTRAGVAPAIADALAHRGPSLVEVVTDAELV